MGGLRHEGACAKRRFDFNDLTNEDGQIDTLILWNII